MRRRVTQAIGHAISGAPKDALDPLAFSVEAAEAWALRRSRGLAADPFRPTALWSLDFVRQPVPGERKTRYALTVAQAESYGIAAGPTPSCRIPTPTWSGETSGGSSRRDVA